MRAYPRMRQAVVKTSPDKTNICKPGRHSAELINLMGARRKGKGRGIPLQYTAGATVHHLALAIKTVGSSADTKRSEV